MKYINTLLNDYKVVVFIDFEGSQFSQEIIAIGAIKCYLDKKNNIKKSAKPFKVFVKCGGEVGPIVTRLTGITDYLLIEQGISFSTAIERLRKYVGREVNKTKYIQYGNFDMRLLHTSANINDLNEDEFINSIFKNDIDFANVLSRFVRSSRNEQLSLLDAVKIFHLNIEGTPHDPIYDAINLRNLFDAFITERGIVKNEYLKVLAINPKLPSPIKKAINQINTTGNCSKEEYVKFIDEDLK